VDVEGFRGSVGLEQLDRVLASVAGKVAVVAIDHGQACSYVAGEVEGGDAGAERERRERVPQVVDPAQRLDPGGALSRLPVAVAEVVEIEVAATDGREHERAMRIGRDASRAASAAVCNGTARTLAFVLGV
jgi:hypothetical protein